MQPEIAINHLAVIVCVIASMPVGYLWFGPLFGTAWARHMGMEDMEPPGGGAMAKSLGLYALGSLLIAFVLAHSIQVWMPSTWGVGENAAPHVYGLNGAIWTWLGFSFLCRSAASRGKGGAGGSSSSTAALTLSDC